MSSPRPVAPNSCDARRPRSESGCSGCSGCSGSCWVSTSGPKSLSRTARLFSSIAAAVEAIGHRLVLQIAFAALVADRAVERMVDQQELHHALAAPSSPSAIWCGPPCPRPTGIAQEAIGFGDFSDLDQAHAAIAGDRQALVKAEMRRPRCRPVRRPAASSCRPAPRSRRRRSSASASPHSRSARPDDVPTCLVLRSGPKAASRRMHRRQRCSESGTASGQDWQHGIIALNQCLLLFPTPTFHLSFCRHRILNALEMLMKYQVDRQPTRGNAVKQPSLMFAYALFKARACHSDVIRAVGTAKDIEIGAH